MNECDKFRSLFSSYIDGEILPENRKSLEDHLAICPPCAQAVKRLKEMCNSLRNLPILTTSPDFEYKLHQQIANIGNSHSIQFSIPIQNWKIPVAASLVVLAGVSVFIIANSSHQSSVDIPVRPSTIKQVNPNKQADRSVLPGKNSNADAVLITQDSLQNDSSRGLRNKGMKLIDEK